MRQRMAELVERIAIAGRRRSEAGGGQYPAQDRAGTGAVIAEELSIDLFQVDLSAIVDKYIGETEKNLEKVFQSAEALDVVLFFDEADALFGSRSEVRDSRDRYANQEVAYLLQRMEQFDGITILATNLRGNLDQAFSRRRRWIRTIRSTSTFWPNRWNWPAATSATSCCRRPMTRSAPTTWWDEP